MCAQQSLIMIYNGAFLSEDSDIKYTKSWNKTIFTNISNSIRTTMIIWKFRSFLKVDKIFRSVYSKFASLLIILV